MNSKQRVHRALRREPVDRVPVFMWFHPDTAQRFAKRLEVPVECLAAAMGDDVRMTWVNNNYAMEGIVHEHDGESHVDEWGIRWQKDGPFNQVVGFPLREADAREITGYQFPTHRVVDLLRRMDPVLRHKEKFFIGCDVSPCVFEMYWRLRGMEQALIDIASDPERTDVMLGRCADFAALLSEQACDRFPLDWLWTGDDVGGQQAMILGPDTWRKMIKPHLEPIFSIGKKRGLWVAYHCCGAIRPIIGDLVEMGLDVLNPIQCNCKGMDAFELKREFG